MCATVCGARSGLSSMTTRPAGTSRQRVLSRSAALTGPPAMTKGRTATSAKRRIDRIMQRSAGLKEGGTLADHVRRGNRGNVRPSSLDFARDEGAPSGRLLRMQDEEYFRLLIHCSSS